MPGLKINSIEVSGFLSFDNIELKDLNENINFIVGPNGSGKTNFAKLMGFIKKAILNPYNFPNSVDIQNYLKTGFGQIKIEAYIDLILSDEEIENVYTIIAILFFDKIISTGLNSYHLSLGNAITFFKSLWNEKFKKGKLIIEYDDVSKNSKMFFRLVNGETIALDLVNNLLITGYNEEYYDEHRNIFSSKTDDEKIFLMGEISNNNINRWSEQDIKYLLLSENLNRFGTDNKIDGEIDNISKVIKYAKKYFIKDSQLGLSIGTNRVSISTIFMWILENSIVTLDNFRCPSKNILSIKEINEMQNFDSNNLYPYLLQLKINKFDDYDKIQETFEKLSNGKSFDIRVKEIKEFSDKTNIHPWTLPTSQTLDAQINQNINSVDVTIIDHKLELQLYFKDGKSLAEYPFEFSPAGYYEMLTLSTAIAGNNNKVIIMDEPAQNLHPTLQHKILLEIDGHNKGNGNSNQFFIITHSPDLVKIDEESIKNIFIFRQKDKDTSINKFEPDKLDQISFFKYEELKRLFFAKGVVLVEGFSEEILAKRLIRNNDFFERIKGNEKFNNDVNIGDIEIVNIEGIGSLVNYIKLMNKLGLHYVAIIDSDIFNPEKYNNKKKKDGIKKAIDSINTFASLVGEKKIDISDLESEMLNNKLKNIKSGLENQYYTYCQDLNFEEYSKKEFGEGFYEGYLKWCGKRFATDDNICENHKKTNYPLYLTEEDKIFDKIIKGKKFKIYTEAVKCLARQIS
jgi:predicted ATP-dependent endonuclease of OLD family